MKILYTLCGLLLLNFCAKAQQTDSSKIKTLKEVKVKTVLSNVDRMPSISGTHLWRGKKTEVLNMDGIDANVAEKTPGQVFAKVPGVFVYDMDGSGNQVNISVRGLNINNVFDKQYFTKRPTMYPGPGVWPSDGRSVNISIGLKI